MSLPNQPNPTSEALKQALSEQSFETLEQLQAFTKQFMAQRNNRSIGDFHGLSPAQMHQILRQPFESPQLIETPSVLEVEPEAEAVTLLKLLFDAIGDKGLKTTATGNLPRNFCREAALQYWGEAKYAERTRYGGINQELDFFDMHIVRVIAQDTGLIRKYKGSFVMTRDCRNLLQKSGMRAIYPRLFRHYIERFNWAYRRRLLGTDFVQHSCFFSLYLLTLYGHEQQSHTFYEDAFIQAFPMAVDAMPVVSYDTQEASLRRDYTYCVLVGLAGFWGLATVQTASDDFLASDYNVKALPLLGEVLRFRISP